jgi:hypothetical protein
VDAATEPGVTDGAMAASGGGHGHRGGDAGAEETGRPTPPRRGYLVPGIIALAACAIIAVVIDVAGLQSHTPTTLVGSQVAQDVSNTLQYQGLGSSPDVRCPAKEPLRVGLVFDCTLVRSGRPAETIRVTVRSKSGGLHIQPLPAG